MNFLTLLSLCILICHGVSRKLVRKFPNDFFFGVATSAYQIEGGWNADDKGESIWDNLTHSDPWRIKDYSNGDVAADSYHNYIRDIKMLRELGVNAYRFSVSWPRILPNGQINHISKAGIAYYNKLINLLIRYEITPFVTMYHWDMPKKLQELGGILHPSFPKWFKEYACVIFQNFGDRVKRFITFNEPDIICGKDMYGKSPMTRIFNDPVEFKYFCALRLIVAHSKAYRAYDKYYKKNQKGEIGIAIAVNHVEPKTESENDVSGAMFQRMKDWGIFADPIFSPDGDWPQEIKEDDQRLRNQGANAPRLPEFTAKEKALNRGACDFFGVNHFTGKLFSAKIGETIRPEWPRSVSPWLYQVPNSLFNSLETLATRYNNTKLYITENGWSTNAGLEDPQRIEYLRAALENVLDAIDVGINLKGYMAWSLMDSFEWFRGYTERFGLYAVNFSNPARTRIPRKSAFVYKRIIKSKVIDHNYEPLTRNMTIDDKDIEYVFE